jgi:1-deoxy-D-xylulose-5-phosphate reductoisomerase
VYNASNEVAVQAFLEGRIRFPEMADVVSEALSGVSDGSVSDVDDVLATDREARDVAGEAARRLSARVGVGR